MKPQLARLTRCLVGPSAHVSAHSRAKGFKPFAAGRWRRSRLQAAAARGPEHRCAAGAGQGRPRANRDRPVTPLNSTFRLRWTPGLTVTTAFQGRVSSRRISIQNIPFRSIVDVSAPERPPAFEGFSGGPPVTSSSKSRSTSRPMDSRSDASKSSSRANSRLAYAVPCSISSCRALTGPTACTFCHRAIQNRPPIRTSKPATLR